ncbi:MAG: GNAT family N-acetyltransferase [Planctomycetaceae bacterium]|nr:GNAT family N-acetyltransferase [Planctomycetaceae bacterium]
MAGLEAVDWPRLAPAGTGDHQAIYQFLLATFQSPSYESFLSALDEPHYEPSDRLLVKRGDQVLGHLRLARRVMQFGALELPVAEVTALAVLPEYRGVGFGSTLLGAVDRALAEDGTLVATLRTGIPQFFGRSGWSLCGRHSYSRASAREVIAQFLPHADSETPPRYIIRPWRQVELPALVRLYRQQIAGGAGAWQRTEATWRWLLGSKSFDQLFVAIDGPDQLELDDANAPIVGYLVLRDDAILEMMTSPDHPEAARELLVRACSELIERNHHQAITLHAPPDHPAHAWFESIGGIRQWREADGGRVGMARILDPLKFLERVAPQLHERAEAAGLDRPTELGLQVGRDKFRLIASRRSVKLGSPQLGRSYLTLGRGDFTRLLLGHLDIDEAIATGQVEASTRTARETARALFPRLPLWRSPLDEPVC